jgi:hypothetical protein
MQIMTKPRSASIAIILVRVIVAVVLAGWATGGAPVRPDKSVEVAISPTHS